MDRTPSGTSLHQGVLYGLLSLGILMVVMDTLTLEPVPGNSLKRNEVRLAKSGTILALGATPDWGAFSPVIA